MDNLNAEVVGSNVCNGLMLGWGTVLAAGMAMSTVTVGVSVGITAVWGGLTWGLYGIALKDV